MQEAMKLNNVTLESTCGVFVEVPAKFRKAHKELQAVKYLSTHCTRTGRMLACLVTDKSMKVNPAPHYGDGLNEGDSPTIT